MSKTGAAILASAVAVIVLIGGCISAYFTMKSDKFIHQETTYEVGWDINGNEVYRKVVNTYDDPQIVGSIYVGIAFLSLAIWITIYKIITWRNY